MNTQTIRTRTTSRRSAIDAVSGERSGRRASRALALRGAVAILVGIALVFWTEPTLVVVLYLFGAFAIIEGILSLVTASWMPSGARGSTVVAGVISVGAGVFAWVWPDITALALLYVIATWAILVGVAELVGGLTRAVRGHSIMAPVRGLLLIVFGVIMWARPGAGALALLTLIGAYSFVSGIALCAAAVDLRREAMRDQRSLQTVGPVAS